MRPITKTAIGVLLGTALAGCAEQGASNDSSSTAGASGATNDTSAQPAYNVEGMMQAMAAALQREKPILKKALESMASLNDVDRTAYREAMQEQRRVGEQIDGMLRANPTWTESTCGWFAKVVQPLHGEVVKLRVQLLKTKDAGARANRFALLQLEAFGSTEAMRSQIEWQAKSQGSSDNLAVMCLKLGHIKDDGAKKR